MVKNRLIACIILRDGQVVQSVCFKHTNVIHYDAIHAVESFNRWSVDEIILLNVSKSSQSRQQFVDILQRVSETCFVPLTAGGWIDTEAYAASLIERGADKLVLNSALHENSELVCNLSKRFGQQCIVASIDYDCLDGDCCIHIDRGTKRINVSPVDWAIRAESLGAGEILLNSISHDGKRKGYDLNTLEKVCLAVNVPVIAFGGVFSWKHLLEGISVGASAVAAANIFHYTEHATKRAKDFLIANGVNVRPAKFPNGG